MKKELKIVVPNGYVIDEKNSTFEKIVFKEIAKPKSWEEYCEQQGKLYKRGYFINNMSKLNACNWVIMGGCEKWRNVLPSKELAEAFLAMMQLMSLRQEWIGDWKPKWGEYKSVKWCIVMDKDRIAVSNYILISKTLSFPTEEMAKEFMDCFWDLLEIAKPLI